MKEAKSFVGTCVDPCPRFERIQRAFERNVDQLEIDDRGNFGLHTAFKSFHRPAAGNEEQIPSDVRPPPILEATLNLLWSRFLDNQLPLSTTHPFIRDRTRSIRQDFTVQNYSGREAITCHEQIARFHILCIHQLIEQENFSLHQELEQLRKVLVSLNEFYDDARKKGEEYDTEPEFRAYSVSYSVLMRSFC